jgi:hypothetical protein
LTKSMISRFERTVRLSIVIYLLHSLTARTEKYSASHEKPGSQKFLHTDTGYSTLLAPLQSPPMLPP